MKVFSVILLGLLGLASALDLSAPAIDKNLIQEINNGASTWKAGVNSRFIGKSVKDVVRLLGVKEGAEAAAQALGPAPAFTAAELAAVPDSYDPRETLGAKCPSIVEVRDQANCGSCWAFGAVEAMTDRICILSNGTSQIHLSAHDMLSCCTSCGFGCNGGYPASAWSYWVRSGLVDGGNYNQGGCAPYPLPNCDHHVDGPYGPCEGETPTPSCPRTCTNGADFGKSKHFGASSYSVPRDEQSIMAELYNRGPVEASFSVYSDWVNYKSGVYVHTSGSYLGGHAVKLIGYGVENGQKYWLLTNSWNEGWGDKGYFKIRRGTNECGIESGLVAGIPKF